MRRAHEAAQERIRRLVGRGCRDGASRTDVPAEWLVNSFFALVHAARDAVIAGELDADGALRALRATVPDLFRGA